MMEIGDYIALDNPRRAGSFVDEIERHCHKLADHPHRFRLREEFGPGMRGVQHGRYLILFRQRDTGEVRIERVVHGSRDLRQFAIEE